MVQSIVVVHIIQMKPLCLSQTTDLCRNYSGNVPSRHSQNCGGSSQTQIFIISIEYHRKPTKVMKRVNILHQFFPAQMEFHLIKIFPNNVLELQKILLLKAVPQLQFLARHGRGYRCREQQISHLPALPEVSAGNRTPPG